MESLELRCSAVPVFVRLVSYGALHFSYVGATMHLSFRKPSKLGKNKSGTFINRESLRLQQLWNRNGCMLEHVAVFFRDVPGRCSLTGGRSNERGECQSAPGVGPSETERVPLKEGCHLLDT